MTEKAKPVVIAVTIHPDRKQILSAIVQKSADVKPVIGIPSFDLADLSAVQPDRAGLRDPASVKQKAPAAVIEIIMQRPRHFKALPVPRRPFPPLERLRLIPAAGNLHGFPSGIIQSRSGTVRGVVQRNQFEFPCPMQ